MAPKRKHDASCQPLQQSFEVERTQVTHWPSKRRIVQHHPRDAVDPQDESSDAAPLKTASQVTTDYDTEDDDPEVNAKSTEHRSLNQKTARSNSVNDKGAGNKHKTSSPHHPTPQPLEGIDSDDDPPLSDRGNRTPLDASDLKPTIFTRGGKPIPVGASSASQRNSRSPSPGSLPANGLRSAFNLPPALSDTHRQEKTAAKPAARTKSTAPQEVAEPSVELSEDSLDLLCSMESALLGKYTKLSLIYRRRARKDTKKWKDLRKPIAPPARHSKKITIQDRVRQLRGFLEHYAERVLRLYRRRDLGDCQQTLHTVDEQIEDSDWGKLIEALLHLDVSLEKDIVELFESY